MKRIAGLVWKNHETVIACDFDRLGRAAALSRSNSAELNVKIDLASYRVPKNWAEHASQLRWLSDSEVLVWPVAYVKGRYPHVGIIGPNGTHTVDLPYPLYIFADRGLIAWCYSEERNVEGGDIIAIFSHPGFQAIANIAEPLKTNYPDYLFLEPQQAVLDGANKNLWLSVYDTDLLWCFSIDNQQIAAGPLGCPTRQIIAITCFGAFASVLTHRGDGLSVRNYKKTGRSVSFQSEQDLPIDANLYRRICDALNNESGRVIGYTDNRIGFLTKSEALLFAL